MDKGIFQVNKFTRNKRSSLLRIYKILVTAVMVFYIKIKSEKYVDSRREKVRISNTSVTIH